MDRANVGSRNAVVSQRNCDAQVLNLCFKRPHRFGANESILRPVHTRVGSARRCFGRNISCELNADAASNQSSTHDCRFDNSASPGPASSSHRTQQPNPALRKLTRSRTWPTKKAELYVLRSDGLSCSRETVHAYGCLSWRHTSTQQELLVWKTRPACVLVIKKLDPALDAHMDAVITYLGEEEGLTVVVEDHEYNRLRRLYGSSMDYLENFDDDEQRRLHQIVDFTVCLGGDGVILHACSLFKESVPPIIGFNLGSMGFLTNHDFETFREDLHDVIYGSTRLETCESERNGVHITLRMRLLCEILRDNVPIPGQRYEVLNEVVVDRGSNPFLTKIECRERGTLITHVQADGVLLSTPTGSTAYSVAAGGSMVHPTLPAILFTPICPHSLAFRPVILPDYADIELHIPPDARCTAWVCFDGKQRQELLHGDSVRVRMSPNPVPTINRRDQTTDWFTSLQRCFGWSDRVAQKPLAPGAYPRLDRNGPLDSEEYGTVSTTAAKQKVQESNGHAVTAVNGQTGSAKEAHDVTGAPNGVGANGMPGVNGAVNGAVADGSSGINGAANGVGANGMPGVNGAVNGAVADGSSGINGAANGAGPNGVSGTTNGAANGVVSNGMPAKSGEAGWVVNGAANGVVSNGMPANGSVKVNNGMTINGNAM